MDFDMIFRCLAKVKVVDRARFELAASTMPR